MEANERPVSIESLCGKWEAVGSEIPSFGKKDPVMQWYHFSSDQFWWEFLDEDGKKKWFRFSYQIREGGFEFRGKKGHPFWTDAFHVAEFLTIRPSHGMETWLLRIGEFGE